MNGEHARSLKRMLDRLGIYAGFSKNSRPIDFTQIDDPNPLELAYCYGTRSALIKVPLIRCRHMRLLAFPCSRETPSPFVQSIMGVNDYCPLERLYQLFCPKNAESVIGIGELYNREIAEAHPASALLPWLPDSITDQINFEKKLMIDESRQHGKRLSLDDGHNFFGPANEEKIELEKQRLSSIFHLIKQNNYQHDLSGYMNINVTCLWSDAHNDWRFLIQGGEHRIAALVALGYTNVIVQTTRHGLTGIVQRSHAAYWPAVRKGYFTEEEATKLFDRVFDGRQPSSYILAMQQSSSSAGG